MKPHRHIGDNKEETHRAPETMFLCSYVVKNLYGWV